jgi:hypothetical protein
MAEALDALLNAWRAQQFTPGARNVLSADATAIETYAAVSHHKSWSTLISSDRFGALEGSAFHVGLLPMPYLGSLKHARVFLVSLNPGLGPPDYFGEHQVAAYREALLANLRQDGDARLPFLEPNHSWHGGSAYWAPRLREIHQGVATRLKLTPRESLELCARRIAVLELVPYHSSNFRMSRRGIDAMGSTHLVRNFVFQELLPRHRKGDCKLIVLRSRELWLRPEDDAAGFPIPGMPRNAYIAKQDAAEAADMICRFI